MCTVECGRYRLATTAIPVPICPAPKTARFRIFEDMSEIARENQIIKIHPFPYPAAYTYILLIVIWGLLHRPRSGPPRELCR